MSRLPHDPFLADAWQQLLTRGLTLPHVARDALLVTVAAFLLLMAWGITHPAHHPTPIHAARSR